MKKVLLVAFVLLIVAVCFVAVACGETPSDNSIGNGAGGGNGNNGTSAVNNGGTDSTTSSPSHTHTYSAAWAYDADYHWHASTCGHSIEKDKALHQWDNGVVTLAATETNEGVLTYTCTICGETKKEAIPKTVVEPTTATISFNLNGGHTSSTATPITVERLDEGDFFFDVTKDGFNFRGWSCDGVKVFDEFGNIINEIALKTNMSFVAEYATTAKLTITTNMPDAGEFSTGGEFAYNSEVDVFARPYQGYEFVGWMYNNATLSNQKDYKYKMWDKDVHLVAKFKYAEFKIDLTSNNADKGLVFINPTGYDNYEAHKEATFAYKTTVTIAAYTKTDTRFLGWYDQDNVLVTTNAVYTFNVPNYDYCLTAKWNYFTITYNLDGGVNSSSNPTSYSVGDDNTLADPVKTTERTIKDYTRLDNGSYSVTYEDSAYTFLGWYTERTYNNRVTTLTLVDGDIVLYAKWGSTTSTTTTESGYLRDGNYLYFGTYPQTEVTDSAIKSALNTSAGTLPTASNSQAWTSYGYYIGSITSTYMWYIDLTYGGEQYRGVYFTSYRPYDTTYYSSVDYSYQDDNGYTNSTVYWFKYEPIKWRILSEADGVALIFAEMALDSQEYYTSSSSSTFSHNGGTGYANNYALSNIRKWLNGTFYNTAFNDLQKELILLTTVDNSARSTNPASNATQWNSGNNTYACANTEDYIFLLSEQEVTDSAYGFTRDYTFYSTARRKQNTDYAKCQGAWTNTDSSYKGNGWWWLRSPYCNGSRNARGVRGNGSTDGSAYVYYAWGGVVPALRIQLQ